jgi:hypothetical protein
MGDIDIFRGRGLRFVLTFPSAFLFLPWVIALRSWLGMFTAFDMLLSVLAFFEYLLYL